MFYLFTQPIYAKISKWSDEQTIPFRIFDGTSDAQPPARRTQNAAYSGAAAQKRVLIDMRRFCGRNSRGIQRILNMNEYAQIIGISRWKILPSAAEGRGAEILENSPQVIHHPVENAWISSPVFGRLSTAKKSGVFWLFGSYPSYPPHYGSYC